jgi:hypothetical protein
MLHRLLMLLWCSCSAALVLPAVMPTAFGVRTRSTAPAMMGNNAPEGPFSPVVRLGKVVLGDKLFNKVRGKAISYHSQAITQFCTEYGVPAKTRGGLVKKAKIVGGDLGFLV